MACVTVVDNVTPEVYERPPVSSLRRSRPHRRSAAALLAAVTALAVPTATIAAPTAGAQALVDNLGRPSPEVLDLVENFAAQPGMPAEVGDTLRRLVSFFRGDGEPGVEVPENGPAFTQFGWPTVATECIGGTENAVGTAIAVPGPAPIPLPGVPAGQAAFVFTALGTGPAVASDTTSMQVHWLNVNSGRMGQTPLLPGTMNTGGPGTVNGLADTGPGTVIAVLSGGITTAEENGHADCRFAPTVGLTSVA
ncbi:hypothetical protein Csp1_09850 [Corynebacterium provencense]|uniref:Secreted protein n=1 Tax=Corynebacterium provencense TaxID=1737425 RepID=A0A2Z3YQB7_9CORY|nr:hypothetical protein Csp1_09850 [Corynebacterium provencense]